MNLITEKIFCQWKKRKNYRKISILISRFFLPAAYASCFSVRLPSEVFTLPHVFQYTRAYPPSADSGLWKAPHKAVPLLRENTAHLS